MRCFHNRGCTIGAIDFIEVAIAKLLSAAKSLSVKPGDILKLEFSDVYFKYLLPFRLFHKLENNLNQAISESWRVLVLGGLRGPFRADNMQNRLTHLVAKRQSSVQSKDAHIAFNKLKLSGREFIELF